MDADYPQIWVIIARRFTEVTILELETAAGQEALSFQDVYPMVQAFVASLPRVASLPELMQLAAAEVQRVTGFDRVLIYRFDADWHGTVVAEARNEWLPAYLDLRFPASDIPRQARELYRLNRLRLIADADYTPVPIVPTNNPLTGRPLDLSFSTLRSVSPVHVEYMKNMGTPASMSISILHDDALWGLISCHHHLPRLVSYQTRTACDFLGQMLSLQLAAREHSANLELQNRLRAVETKLLQFLAEEENFVEGLRKHPEELLEIAGAQGAAVLFEGKVALLGRTPGEGEVTKLVDWLAATVHEESFHTDALPMLFPPAEAYRDCASGLLAVSVSRRNRGYVLWFRPEVVQTVTWGGDPRKPVEPGQERLHPRKSFEIWKETVRGRSLPWQPAEIETAGEFRNAIVGIVLRKAEELAALSQELEQSNKELEAFSYSVSHDLRAPFRHIVGYAELLKELYAGEMDATGRRYVDTIIESAEYAGTLVDNLLTFSQMGRASLNMLSIDLNQLIREIQQEMVPELEGRQIIWKIESLPTVRADVVMLRLVLYNLLSNAVKYTRPRPEAVITVGSVQKGSETIFFVRDNGVGFDMRYSDKLFGVFQRLHRIEDFEGTGIGLANVRRIVLRHGGRTWAEGAVNQGATFYFTLPILP